MNNFKELLNAEKLNTEKYLNFYLDSLHIRGILRDAMAYALNAGGKRIRPFLAVAVSQILNKPKEIVMPYACALEFIHTYSLIHDDLPAIDNDDLRRGKPTCHKVFGEEIAILAGDALNSDAFSILFEFGEGNFKEGGKYFAKAVGGRGMVFGQVKDCATPEEERNAEILDEINFYKTSNLIIASTAGAAAWLDAKAEEIQALAEYGKNIGLAFQIADDILDIVSTDEELGKSVGKDALLKKITYPSLLGVEKSREIAKELVEKAIRSINFFKRSTWQEALVSFAGYTLERRS